MGVRLRSLRQERGLTQVALAQALGISPSYLNQLEQDQRPFTVPVLLKVHRVLGVDIQQFSEDAQARLVAQLSDAVAAVPDLPAVPQAELRELAAKLPQLSQTLLAMHRRHQQDTQRLHTLADRLSRVGMDEAPGWVDDALPPGQMPFEAVRDFFFAHRNYFDSLDRAAEALAQQAQAQGGALPEWLTQHLRHQHGVFVLRSEAGDAPLR
ncbi:MAG: helix-turn-helix domain-containing protein, partial [Acidovorax sp.]|nr:helix-turn-helix domain-containing protein [Acidovorax sp.]